ncbi:unnamed protein product [Schistosoma mattheei]|uniref:Uncharacterized protein n=1 Tax=Schistosoma mattheei TaxID=31246 RepID=A0A183PX70_9TREM|nr:unnamed protein product [Schistosoma mattheei]
MNIDVKEWACSYVSRQKSRVVRYNKDSLGSFKTPDARFDHVHMNSAEHLPDPSVYFYLLTYEERFARWPEAEPIKDITAEKLAHAFVER